jgi:hypothetical protein
MRDLRARSDPPHFVEATMTSHSDEQKLKADTFDNDRKVASTMFEHAVASADDDRGGRFAGVNKTVVVGSSPVAYPPLPSSSPWSGAQPEPGPEPPLGYSIDQMYPDPDPSALRDPAEATGGPATAPSDGGNLPSRDDVMSERAGPSPLSEETTDD